MKRELQTDLFQEIKKKRYKLEVFFCIRAASEAFSGPKGVVYSFNPASVENHTILPQRLLPKGVLPAINWTEVHNMHASTFQKKNMMPSST
jgi:hypothetical protein